VKKSIQGLVEIYGQQIKFDYETLENVMQARSHVANDSKTDDMANRSG
jgi:hypothetical protein